MRSDLRVDALVIGGGPAGATAALRLAVAGWDVMLVEQRSFPRQKVCGECLPAGALDELDALGAGEELRAAPSPELRRLAWMDGRGAVIADLPACEGGGHRYGRALGRDRLDEILLRRAAEAGACVLQPARLRRVDGVLGRFECEVQVCERAPQAWMVRAPVVIDARGSSDRPPLEGDEPSAVRGRDLLAFKASFRDARLSPGLLALMAFPGGYGGMVLAEEGRTTLACCLRRDVLQAHRELQPGVAAGSVVEALLRGSCAGVEEALRDARRLGAWQGIGPVRPGPRPGGGDGPLRIGNAAGEGHPLAGEGVRMALESAAMLARRLASRPPREFQGATAHRLARDHEREWRLRFGPRLRSAALAARIAMTPGLADAARSVLQRWPGSLTRAAALVGKDRPACSVPRARTVSSLTEIGA